MTSWQLEVAALQLQFGRQIFVQLVAAQEVLFHTTRIRESSEIIFTRFQRALEAVRMDDEVFFEIRSFGKALLARGIFAMQRDVGQ